MVMDMETTDHRRQTRGRRLAGAKMPRVARRDRESWRGESAAIYCRISHVRDQDQTGVDRQERICRRVAKRLGLEVDAAHVFVDNNRSAWQRNRRRKGWDELLEALQGNRVQHVVAYHPDRLMRQPRDLEELLTIADERDITLHGEANQRDLSDPDDRYFLRIEVAHACRSSDDTSRRLKDTMVERAHDGKPHTGKRRYGYAQDAVTIIGREAEIVREVFERYAAGESVRGIANDLNARGVPTTQGKAWMKGTVLSLLDSRHVAGIRVFRGEEIGRGEWPAIIGEGMWNEVRARRAVRDTPSSSARSQRFYLLRGLVTCKRCGTGMAGSSGVYHCNRRDRKDGARCVRAIKAAVLEEFVTEAALRLLENLGSTIPEAGNVAVLSEADQAAVREDQQELATLKVMWDAREIKTHEYREMRRTVEARIDRIQAKTVVRPTAEILRGVTGPRARVAWQSLVDSGNCARMNAILRFLFAAVIIDESRAGKGRFDYDRIDIDPNPL
jgi:site-specific DNA recombinase